ncbi:hypothetical protein ACJX0J_016928 [Zea mays]
MLSYLTANLFVMKKIVVLLIRKKHMYNKNIASRGYAKEIRKYINMFTSIFEAYMEKQDPSQGQNFYVVLGKVILGVLFQLFAGRFGKRGTKCVLKTLFVMGDEDDEDIKD